MDDNVGKAAKVIEQVNKVILGKDRKVKEIMTAFLAGGHILLEDIPGVGKTTLATAFSKAMKLDCKRVQSATRCCYQIFTGCRYTEVILDSSYISQAVYSVTCCLLMR